MTDKLNSETFFYYVPFVSYRKSVIEKDIEKLSPHTLGKNGKFGIGGVVGMPTIMAVDPNLSAPQSDLFLPIDVIEYGELNFQDDGTKITAEEIAKGVRAHAHHFAIEGIGCFYQDTRAIEPLAGLDHDYPGCVGYRVMMRLRLSESSAAKASAPTIVYAGGLVALTNTLAGATIYYTTDQSFSGPGNAAALVYAAPFAANVGDVIRFAAYKAAFQGSDIAKATLTA